MVSQHSFDCRNGCFPCMSPVRWVTVSTRENGRCEPLWLTDDRFVASSMPRTCCRSFPCIQNALVMLTDIVQSELWTDFLDGRPLFATYAGIALTLHDFQQGRCPGLDQRKWWADRSIHVSEYHYPHEAPNSWCLTCCQQSLLLQPELTPIRCSRLPE
jgi:hypothetical protein